MRVGRSRLLKKRVAQSGEQHYPGSRTRDRTLERVAQRRGIFDVLSARVDIQEGRMLILFGGGDGGGIYVGADGKVHRIPPWTPDIQVQLKAVNALVALENAHETALTKEATALAERLSTKVIPQITKTIGTPQLGDTSVAFVDGDDGFVCGSTGKHPIPVPHRVAANLYSPVTSQQAVHA